LRNDSSFIEDVRWSSGLIALALVVSSCAPEISRPSPSNPPDIIFPPFHTDPDWTRNGEILYSDAGIVCLFDGGSALIDPSRKGIWRLRLSDGMRERLLPYGDAPHLSPDGTRVAFGSGAGVSVLDLASAEVTTVSVPGVSAFLPRWSPDGQSLAWDSSSRRYQGIWIDPPGETPELVLRDYFTPDWHPDGERLVCIGWFEGDKPGFVEYEVATGRTRLLYENQFAIQPRYSPDGKEIAFIWLFRTNLRSEIGIFDTESEEVRQLTYDGGTTPSWSPDGKQIVFLKKSNVGMRPGDGLLWIIDLATGEERKITEPWPEDCPGDTASAFREHSVRKSPSGTPLENPRQLGVLAFLR
jgi:Tol biopolymer transport system component